MSKLKSLEYRFKAFGHWSNPSLRARAAQLLFKYPTKVPDNRRILERLDNIRIIFSRIERFIKES